MNAQELKAVVQQTIEANRQKKQDLTPVNAINTIENIRLIGESVIPKFQINEVYKDLILYFLNDLKCKYDVSKGLFIHGRTGTGKTILSKVFNIFNQIYNPKKNYRLINSAEIPRAYELGGIATMDEMLKGTCMIDDLGGELIEATHYGTKAEPMKDFLFSRYTMFQDTGKLTHATTNYTMEYVEKMYGKRVESRFSEMFNDVVLDGEDLRK